MRDTRQFLETSEASIIVSLNTLKRQNLIINGHRTTVTLEPHIWGILKDVAQEQGRSVHDLCSFISDRKNQNSSLSSAIRVFLISYLNVKLKKGLQ